MEELILHILQYETDNIITDSKKSLEIKCGTFISNNIFDTNIPIDKIKNIYTKITRTNSQNKLKITDTTMSMYYDQNKVLQVDTTGGMTCLVPYYIHHEYLKKKSYDMDLKFTYVDYLNSPVIEFPCKTDYTYVTTVNIRTIKINDKIHIKIANNTANDKVLSLSIIYNFMNKKIDHVENIKVILEYLNIIFDT